MLGCIWLIHFIGRHQFWFFNQTRHIQLQLIEQHAEVRDRLTPISAFHINHHQQHLAALDVLEEAMPEATVFTRAFDQAGNVGHCNPLIVLRILQYADHRKHRGKRIGTRFRMRIRDHV